MIKITRRGWLTALSSFVALPLLPKSATATDEVAASSHSLVDHFASFPFDHASGSRPGMEFWEDTVRVPVAADELQVREELLRDSIHHLRAQSFGPRATPFHESDLRSIDLARAILRHLPTGRPLTFRYAHGSTPGAGRTVLPTLLFHTEQPYPRGWEVLEEMTPPEYYESRPLYLQAYCLERLAPRTFRLDRIHGLTPLA